MSRQISPVVDSQDKKNTYQYNIRRYNKAMKEGFYFEALLIDYAMMEDRLRSFLYHMGLLNTRESHKADVKKVKKSLKSIIQKYKRSGESDNFSIISISGKMKIIRCTLLWAEQELNSSDDSYLLVLRNQYDKYIDTERFINTLNEIENWCAYRNEIIHALMNKNVESTYQDLAHQATEGMRLCRELDNQVGRLKTGNRIRKSMKLQNK